NMKKSQTRWSATSPSFLIAAAIAAFMLFLGVRGLLAPEAAAHGFGFAVVDPSDAVWLRIKGDRDLSVALAMGIFLALRWRRALGAYLLASIAGPCSTASFRSRRRATTRPTRSGCTEVRRRSLLCSASFSFEGTPVQRTRLRMRSTDWGSAPAMTAT